MSWESITQAVLLQYDVIPTKVEFLRHNENAVFRVETADAMYVLRLHTAAVHAEHRSDWLAAELEFLHALSSAHDIQVQKPMSTKSGGWLASMPDGAGDASLLSWLPGEAMRQNMDDAVELATKVGKLAASLHTFALAHPELNNLTRPIYDGNRIITAANMLQEGLDKNLFDPALYPTITNAAHAIAEVLDAENKTQGQHGLIHADLGLGNLIVHEGTVSPIDFSLCGHGPFCFDVGGLMGTFDHAPLRTAVLDGYRAHSTAGMPSTRAIEAGFLTGIYLFMAMHQHNPHVREWFTRRLPLVCSDYLQPFLDGSTFLRTLLA